ncbi:hypothetical protein [Humidisolicoccus flavus]|uniref:hypothetical protein n=1 Tax=Humidisolicoccus flavus TaxID=3111414 RepID=UPI0032466DBD
MRRSTILSAAVLAASALVLTGCSAGEPDVAAVDLGAAGEITEPGTTLAFEAPAWVDADGATVGVTVLDIIEKDESFWNEADAETFAGQTPYLIVTQFQYPEGTNEDERPQIALYPIYEDGTDAQYVVTEGIASISEEVSNACELNLAGYDADTASEVTCFIGSADAGKPITGVIYPNHGYNEQFIDPENLYFDSPVTWQ